MSGAVMTASPWGGAGTARRAAGSEREPAPCLRVRALSGLGEISPVWVSEGVLEHVNRGRVPRPGK